MMPGETRFPVPEWSTVHRELRRKGVTLALLWQEYKETHPEGMQYSRFCQMYRAWAAKLDVVMRLEHRAGEKAKAEVGVQVVERWVLAALRHRTFFSLAELNAAIAKLLERLNNRPFRKLPGSRRSLFEQLDRPALRPLPTERYVFAEWKKARVNIDYHVEVDRHYYSVPHALVGREVDVRLTATTVECLYRSQRVASHVRSPLTGRHTTADEHMPEKHRKIGQWSPERFMRWASTIGPNTATLIETVLRSPRSAGC